MTSRQLLLDVITFGCMNFVIGTWWVEFTYLRISTRNFNTITSKVCFQLSDMCLLMGLVYWMISSKYSQNSMCSIFGHNLHYIYFYNNRFTWKWYCYHMIVPLLIHNFNYFTFKMCIFIHLIDLIMYFRNTLSHLFMVMMKKRRLFQEMCCIHV